MVRKLGLDPNDPDERALALQILTDKGIVDEDDMTAWPQICLMAKSISTAEFTTCLTKNPVKRKIHIFHEHHDVVHSPELPLETYEESVSFHLHEDVHPHLK